MLLGVTRGQSGAQFASKTVHFVGAPYRSAWLQRSKATVAPSHGGIPKELVFVSQLDLTIHAKVKSVKQAHENLT